MKKKIERSEHLKNLASAAVLAMVGRLQNEAQVLISPMNYGRIVREVFNGLEEGVPFPPKESNKEKDPDYDELYDKAARLVVKNQDASASLLQRTLRIGYSRASNLLDTMEIDGLISEPSRIGPARVLVKPDYFKEIDK